MTEYNPNYEFAGGSCSIQDLREVDRENLVLVKWVAPHREILRNKYLIISELWARGHLVKFIKEFSRTKLRLQRHRWQWKHCQNSPLIKVGLIFLWKKFSIKYSKTIDSKCFSLIIYPSHVKYILQDCKGLSIFSGNGFPNGSVDHVKIPTSKHCSFYRSLFWQTSKVGGGSSQTGAQVGLLSSLASFRFIILELLAGGDLKSFLRESRSKPVSCV